MCLASSDGEINVVEQDYTCASPTPPSCPPCHSVVSYVDGCCPAFKCVQDEVCCSDGTSKMVIYFLIFNLKWFFLIIRLNLSEPPSGKLNDQNYNIYIFEKIISLSKLPCLYVLNVFLFIIFVLQTECIAISNKFKLWIEVNIIQ